MKSLLLKIFILQLVTIAIIGLSSTLAYDSSVVIPSFPQTLTLCEYLNIYKEYE